MQPCPVCETTVSDDALRCPTCGWALTFFLSSTEEEAKSYREKLDAARTKWQQHQANPLLKRSSVETHSQFKQRLETEPMVAGHATLVIDAARNDAVPLQVEWFDWLPNMAQDLFVTLNNESTSTWLQDSDEQISGDVLVQLHVDERDQVGITQLFFRDEQQDLHLVRQFCDEDFWLWVQRQNSVAAYQAYLCSDTLKNYRHTAQQGLEQRHQQLQHRERIILASSFGLATTGAMLGTMLGYYSSYNFIGALFGGVLGAGVLLGSIFWLYTLWYTQRLIDGHTSCVVESVNQRKLNHNQLRVDKDRMSYLHIRGWAVDEQNKRAANAVYLQVQNKEYIALYGQQRPDIQRHFPGTQYQYIGFLVSLDTTQLTAGTHQLNLKIISADKRAYYLMPNVLTLLV